MATASTSNPDAVDLNAVAFSSDGLMIVTAASDATARLWDGLTGKHIASLAPQAPSVTWAAFTPDNQLVITADVQSDLWPAATVRIWDAKSRELLAAIGGHAGRIVDAAIWPNGTRIVTASADHTARILPLTPQGFLAAGCAAIERRPEYSEFRDMCAPLLAGRPKPQPRW